jgi:hypothetical protein
MRFCVLILYFDCDQFILRTIENCAPHVEKIFVAYSPVPWTYNPEARKNIKNPSTPEILSQSQYRDKIQLIEGTWETEEAQRNEVLDLAKSEGFDYLIIQDADEFFRSEDYQLNLKTIEQNPNFAFYKTPWYQFWKSTKWVILCKYSYLYKNGVPCQKFYNTTTCFSMAFAINIKANVRFHRCRMPTNIDDYLVLPGICYHLSYVMSDEQVERKIRTYGHTNQIDHKNWLKWKWYGWNPKTRFLHPIESQVWTKAVAFTGQLPKELENFPEQNNLSKPLPLQESIREFVWETRARLKTTLKSCVRPIKTILAKFTSKSPTKK